MEGRWFGRAARRFVICDCLANSQRPPPQDVRDWRNLPPEITTLILSKVGAVDLLLNVQIVCYSWFDLCKDPSIWRSLELIKPPLIRGNAAWIERICKIAVDRSCGYLESVNIEYFCTNHLLRYIAQRSPNLRRLRLFSCSELASWGFREAAPRLRLLEDVEITRCEFNPDCFGWFCPRLTSFKLNYASIRENSRGPTNHLNGCVIGSTMPGLRHLQLLGFRRLSRKGLLAILEGCTRLQSLDLRDVPDQDLLWESSRERFPDPYAEMSPEEISELEMRADESELEKRCAEIPEQSELEKRCVAKLKEFRSWKETTVGSRNCLRQTSPTEFCNWLEEVEHPYKDNPPY